ncbi:MAG TPA: TIGR03857 family LLM class F420-dependent oxidoreductase [Acidimicrobiales bacterium]|nr:TIGR03857 family LLM class F420-dependent oxidoreductase [Acidimicrobiales bacterium]
MSPSPLDKAHRPPRNTAGRVLAELGFYALAGHAESSRDLVDEVRLAERLGLGAAFISERFDKKEAAVLSGAAGAVTERMTIVTAATNHNTRHPMITAGIARTMQSLTGGRFVLGLGRGIPVIQDTYGIPRVTTAQLEQFVGIMRRLFRGEVIMGHDGGFGPYPVLYLAAINEELPLGLVAFGPHSLALGGRCFDQVILHTFFTEETTRRCVATVKEAAVRADRDPDAVKVWSCFATIGDHISEERRLMKSVGRLATYLQGYGDLLVHTNGWDPTVLERFRADSVVSGFVGGIDSNATPDQLEHIATLLPDEWLAPSATGSPAQCVTAIRDQLAMGCDGVILHGATPTELEPIVAAYRN